MNVFDDWNQQKQDIDKSGKVLFKQQEVWFLNMGKNIGSEQDGKGESFLRPILVFRKFNKDVFWGIPLTTTKKEGKFYYSLGEIQNKQAYLILSQLRLLDSRRLQYKIGRVSWANHQEIREKVKKLL